MRLLAGIFMERLLYIVFSKYYSRNGLHIIISAIFL